MNKFRLMIAALAAIFMVAFTATAANAATASAGEFNVFGQSAIIADTVSGGNVVRVNGGGSSVGYANTTVLQGVLNAKPSQTIQVCVKYRSAQNGYPAHPIVTNGYWSVEFPNNFSKDYYQDNCLYVTNTASQPQGAVAVIHNGSTAALVKNVRIN